VIEFARGVARKQKIFTYKISHITKVEFFRLTVTPDVHSDKKTSGKSALMVLFYYLCDNKKLLLWIFV